MNEEGEYVLKTQCPFCVNYPLKKKFKSTGCMYIERKNMCSRFKKLETADE